MYVAKGQDQPLGTRPPTDPEDQGQLQRWKIFCDHIQDWLSDSSGLAREQGKVRQQQQQSESSEVGHMPQRRKLDRKSVV